MFYKGLMGAYNLLNFNSDRRKTMNSKTDRRRRGWTRPAILLAAISLAAAAVTAPAATYHVATNGLDSNHGESWLAPFLTISNAVAAGHAAGAGSVVLVSNGLYLTTAEILITNALTVRSWNEGALDLTNTVVQRAGPGFHRLFLLQHPDALVEGFTITNGQITAGYGGAGVYINQGGTLRDCIVAGCVATNSTATEVGGVMIYQTGLMANCVIDNNRGYRAGGVYLSEGGMVSNCLVVNNTNTYNSLVHGSGGGIRIVGGGTAICCTVTGNLARAYGGGIYINTGAVYNCDVIGNTALVFGGGIFMGPDSYVADCLLQSNLNEAARSGALFFYQGGLAENCRILDNRGNCGGGVNFYKSGTLRDSLICGNIATNYGGGAVIVGGVLENCTIVSNTRDSASATGGGGLYLDYRLDWILLVNNIIYGNISTIGSNYYHQTGTVTTGGYVYSNCCVAPLPVQQVDCLAEDPLFADPAAGNYRLQRDSPCVNSGLNQPWMAGDLELDNHHRLDRFNRLVDRGAYEYVFPGTMFGLR